MTGTRHDSTQLIPLVDALPVVRGKRGRLWQRPRWLYGDRGYAAVGIAIDQGNDMARAHWLVELARIQLARRDTGDALTSSQQAAAIQRRLGDRTREAAAIDLAGQAYQQLDRHEDAAKFHRQAANVHRDLNNRWHLAIALDHLATALEHLDEPAEADRCRREAITQLDQFTDPLALALRERLRQQSGSG